MTMADLSMFCCSNLIIVYYHIVYLNTVGQAECKDNESRDCLVFGDCFGIFLFVF